LDFRPDIIHGQHHLDAMTALACLPGVPAVYHCHGAVWRETPPVHPRIRRYFAMSRTLKERMMVEGNLRDEQIDVVLNGVDLTRFRTPRSIPARPSRVLFYNGHHQPNSPTLAAAREAARRLGLDFQTLGWHFGKMTTRPEEELPKHDIVLASGRSAIDAMACGCAVMVLGRNTCAGLVTPENFDRWREVNFSAAANLLPPEPEELMRAMEAFDAVAVAEVTRRLRTCADSRLMVEHIVGTYEQVIAEHRSQGPDPAAEMAAMADYLRRLVPVVKFADQAQRESDLAFTKKIAFDGLKLQLHRFLEELEKTP
jgi:sugar phosphate isomerase/epimerase